MLLSLPQKLRPIEQKRSVGQHPPEEEECRKRIRYKQNHFYSHSALVG